MGRAIETTPAGREQSARAAAQRSPSLQVTREKAVMERPCLSEAMRTEQCGCQLLAIPFLVQSPHLTEMEIEIFKEGSDGSHVGPLTPSPEFSL